MLRLYSCKLLIEMEIRGYGLVKLILRFDTRSGRVTEFVGKRAVSKEPSEAFGTSVVIAAREQ